MKLHKMTEEERKTGFVYTKEELAELTREVFNRTIREYLINALKNAISNDYINYIIDEIIDEVAEDVWINTDVHMISTDDDLICYGYNDDYVKYAVGRVLIKRLGIEI